MLAENVQKNMKAIRLKKAMTQGQLAEKTSLSISYLSELERGNRSPPLETVENIAGGLGVSPYRLLATPKSK